MVIRNAADAADTADADTAHTADTLAETQSIPTSLSQLGVPVRHIIFWYVSSPRLLNQFQNWLILFIILWSE